MRRNGLFSTIYAGSGRASVAPEKQPRALLLQVFTTVRSERMLMEQMRYNLLFRWFVGLAIENAAWDHSVFSKNCDRLLEHEVIEAFFIEVMRLADKQRLLSRKHFSVDGTLIQALASHKSFRPKDGSDDPPAGDGRNVDTDLKGKRRSNDTHESSTDPDARLKVALANSNRRWRSDDFEFHRDDGEPLRVTFALDCCVREAMSWVAATSGRGGNIVCDAMLPAFEHCFGNAVKAPAEIEWLTDNGSGEIAQRTRAREDPRLRCRHRPETGDAAVLSPQ